MPDVQVLSIPFGAIIALRGFEAEDANKLRADIQRIAEHDKFVIVVLPEDGDVTVLGNDEILTALRATLADEVSDELVERAEAAARHVSSLVQPEPPA